MQTDTTIATLADDAQALTEQPPQGIERTMLAQDRLPVVLAVVLLVWVGVLLLLARTERRLARVERQLDALEGGDPARREPGTDSAV